MRWTVCLLAVALLVPSAAFAQNSDDVAVVKPQTCVLKRLSHRAGMRRIVRAGLTLPNREGPLGGQVDKHHASQGCRGCGAGYPGARNPPFD